jgi:hypothetical protein
MYRSFQCRQKTPQILFNENTRQPSVVVERDTQRRVYPIADFAIRVIVIQKTIGLQGTNDRLDSPGNQIEQPEQSNVLVDPKDMNHRI